MSSGVVTRNAVVSTLHGVVHQVHRATSVHFGNGVDCLGTLDLSC
jgi:hypothetical protein